MNLLKTMHYVKVPKDLRKRVLGRQRRFVWLYVWGGVLFLGWMSVILVNLPVFFHLVDVFVSVGKLIFFNGVMSLKDLLGHCFYLVGPFVLWILFVDFLLVEGILFLTVRKKGGGLWIKG